jgi:hypothetical protein
MTLNDRERFIQHYITITTLRTLVDRVKTGDISIAQLARIDIESPNTPEINKHDVDVIWKNRCRKLTEKEIASLFEDLAEEALVGGSAINDMLL